MEEDLTFEQWKARELRHNTIGQRFGASCMHARLLASHWCIPAEHARQENVRGFINQASVDCGAQVGINNNRSINQSTILNNLNATPVFADESRCRTKPRGFALISLVAR